jgi:hypothetical protein
MISWNSLPEGNNKTGKRALMQVIITTTKKDIMSEPFIKCTRVYLLSENNNVRGWTSSSTMYCTSAGAVLQESPYPKYTQKIPKTDNIPPP